MRARERSCIVSRPRGSQSPTVQYSTTRKPYHIVSSLQPPLWCTVAAQNRRRSGSSLAPPHLPPPKHCTSSSSSSSSLGSVILSSTPHTSLVIVLNLPIPYHLLGSCSLPFVTTSSDLILSSPVFDLYKPPRFFLGLHFSLSISSPTLHRTPHFSTYFNSRSVATMTRNILITLLRNDLRLHDHPIFHLCSEPTPSNTQFKQPLTHVLPVYVWDQRHVEVSGFPGLQKADKNGAGKGEKQFARTRELGLWRTGVHRTKYVPHLLPSLFFFFEHGNYC